jgi:DNA polymerase type B, organellar and viral
MSNHGKSGFKRPASVSDVQTQLKSSTKRNAQSVRSAPRRFVGWDGEATKDAGYCLIGNSLGDELCHPDLATKDILEFLLRFSTEHKNVYNIGYVFDYDVNNILKDLSWMSLIMLKERGRCSWNGYRIEHIPGKCFTVRDSTRRFALDDIFSFFRSPYCTGDKDNPGALDKYSVGSCEIREQISIGKSNREDFYWKDIGYITQYFRLELQCMPLLMDKVREACESARIYIRRWYGPGALAKAELNKHHTKEHLRITDERISLPVRTAYAGGWFERFKCGMYLGPVYTADLNSAYAWAMSLLPSLANGEWEYIDGERARDCTEQLGIHHIRYGTRDNNLWQDFMRSSRGIPLPLFQRGSSGNISRPFRTAGWYWNYEARNVHRSANCDWLGAWVFHSDGTYPFEWIEGAYDARLDLKAVGDPAEKALKWMLASLYGTMAQRSGWNRRHRTAPRFHQLEYAGATTSACRSMMYRVAMPVALQDGLISIDTDGVTSTVPFSKLPGRGEGNGLGQWKLERFSGIIYFQNGIYWLRDMQGAWLPAKTRGIPYGKIGDYTAGIDALHRNGELSITRRSFVGYGAALHRSERNSWRTWEDSEYTISLHHSPSRHHSERICRACRKGL